MVVSSGSWEPPLALPLVSSHLLGLIAFDLPHPRPRRRLAVLPVGLPVLPLLGHGDPGGAVVRVRFPVGRFREGEVEEPFSGEDLLNMKHLEEEWSEG